LLGSSGAFPEAAGMGLCPEILVARTEDGMATTKRRTPPRSASKAVTAERAARLVRLLQLLGTGPQTRVALARRLRLDIRSFYRDLELLRGTGIPLVLRNH